MFTSIKSAKITMATAHTLTMACIQRKIHTIHFRDFQPHHFKRPRAYSVEK